MIEGPLLSGQRILNSRGHEAEVVYLKKRYGRLWVGLSWWSGPLRGDMERMTMKEVRTQFRRKSEGSK